LVLIYASRDVKAALDSVWDVISDIDREPEFWHGTKSIKNISKTGNTIEREVVIAFKNSKCREIVKLDNKKSINIDIIQGPIRGRKTITLKTITDHTTRIDVEWDIRLSGSYGIFTGMIKKHILRGTEEALERISEKVSYA
jgi:ribosome-associated toxin RatA of RatAB toxin-antitoxin module